jgi:hypothetical protein
MKGSDGFVQAYIAQAAVESKSQLMVAHAVTQEANDKQQIKPMVQTIELVGFCTNDVGTIREFREAMRMFQVPGWLVTPNTDVSAAIEKGATEIGNARAQAKASAAGAAQKIP